MDKRIPLIAAIVLVTGAVVAVTFMKPPGTPTPEAPLVIQEPAPAPAPPDTSKDPDGPEAKQDLIRVTSPKPGDTVTSPLTVTGEARGTWYFEASFPIRLYDANGKELAVAVAQAQGEWMTMEFVPFSATLEFAAPATAEGTLVLQKDNPSGLPEHDDQLRIAVRFDASAKKPALGGCRKTGCSGQVCADEDVITTCEFREEYACYQDATCERQPGGACGWTPSAKLTACLASKGAAQ